MSKLTITPVLVAIEWFAYGKAASARVLSSIAVLLVGITLCTVTDTQVSSNPVGVVVAGAAVLVTSLYQVRRTDGLGGWGWVGVRGSACSLLRLAA